MTVARTPQGDIPSILEDIMQDARKRGATAVAISHHKGRSTSVTVRNGKCKSRDISESASFNIQAFIGDRSAETIIKSFRPEHLAQAIDKVIANARTTPENPYAALAAPDQIATSYPTIESFDPTIPNTAELEEQALAAEAAMLASPGMKSKKAGAAWGRSTITRLFSNGFHGTVQHSNSSLYAVGMSEQNDQKETGYDQSVAVFRSDLDRADDIGRNAAEKTLCKLSARKAPVTGNVPVVFAPEMTGALIGAFTKAIGGGSIAARSSFLKNSLGKQIFPKNISIIDDPFLPRGLGSRSFSGDGLPVRQTALVEDGILKTWILSLQSARELNLEIKQHANGLSNLFLKAAAGAPDPATLIGDIKNGLYVTNIMGHGANIVNGSFSQGAFGFWIEDGKIAYPVSRATIAGKLEDMFMNITPANDLNIKKYSAPTLRIEGMTVAG